MSGFRKAKAEQAALKLGLYGAQGSGKTFTSLLLAEGLAKATRKRIAIVDTERGTDFYCQKVAARPVHPEAFDFDTLYTRSMTEVIGSIKGLDTDQYGVVIIDSITHIWEAAKAAYAGKMTRIGTIPMQAWGPIKRPYKDLMSFLLSSPMHVILCGRQGVEYETDEETDELKAVGVKMKAEGETPYEPHILIRMESIRPKRTSEIATIMAYVEKDRTGVLNGRTFENPTFMSLCAPLLGLLGNTQARIAGEEETASIDAEQLAAQERLRESESADWLRKFTARIELCDSADQLKAIGKEITPQIKAKMLPADVSALRDKYQEREESLGKSESKKTRKRVETTETEDKQTAEVAN